MWENKTAPVTSRGLTTTTRLKDVVMAAAHLSTCRPWDGDAASYQEMALRVHVDIEARESVLPWVWFASTCGTSQCLRYGHFFGTAPRKIAYPALLCIYCGRPGGTKDHLLPRNITGEYQRRFVATVPACTACNSMLGDFSDYRITARRKDVHDKIRYKHRNVLTPVADYRPLEGYLRSYVKTAGAKKAQIEAVLMWPEDPFFDLRAFQKSGIEDPYALGLI